MLEYLKMEMQSVSLPSSRSYASDYIGRKFRATLEREVSIEGIGLHSGTMCKLYFQPAEAGTGIVFRNIKSGEKITVNPFSVIHTRNSVCLAGDSWSLCTVEHLLAALSTLGVSDVIINVDGNEIPILDGSGSEFFYLLHDAGLREFAIPVNPIRLSKPVWVVSGDKYIIALPSEEFQVTYTIDYDHPDLREKKLSKILNSYVMQDEILPARTFGFLKDVEYLRKQGMIKGASLENALVLTETGYLNHPRFPDECIRHKILDLVGDLYLLNRPVIAHIVAYKTGHTMDVALVKNIRQYLQNEQESYFF